MKPIENRLDAIERRLATMCRKHGVDMVHHMVDRAEKNLIDIHHQN